MSRTRSRCGGLVKVAVTVVLLVILWLSPCLSLVAQCPRGEEGLGAPGTQPESSYCSCHHYGIRSGFQISIKCDFMKREDVVLSEAVYPLAHSRAMGVYVRVRNASSVRVTTGFLGAWLGLPSSGLDLWNCGTVTLEPAPPPTKTFHPSFTTSAGIGVIDCDVKELPSKLLRDRHTVSLRIKNSVVGTIRKEIFYQIPQLRYLVMENSAVGKVEGAVASGGRTLTLDRRHNGTWNGLVFSNVTIQDLAPATFTITHKAMGVHGLRKIEMLGCRVGKVGTGAITVAGDLAVTIKGNNFDSLAPSAFKIDVRGDVKFEENVAVHASPRSLESVVCHNLTSLEKNTVHVDAAADSPQANISFHQSCGFPQMFTVVSPTLPLVQQVASMSTWILLTVLLLVVAVSGGAAVKVWRRDNHRREFCRDDSFHFHNGLTRDEPEVKMKRKQEEDEEAREGVSNPLYEDMEYKSSL